MTVIYSYIINFQAQTEELAVLRKCSTTVIYKSSALLTINKLRKESLGMMFYDKIYINFLSIIINELIFVLQMQET